MGNKKSIYGYTSSTTGQEVIGNKNLENQHFVITGSTSGIGFGTVKCLYNANGIITMICRNKEKMENVKEMIMKNCRKKDCKGVINMIVMDLGSQKSIKNGVEELSKSEYNRIDVLINNAALRVVPLSRTDEGYESHIGVNYLGHFSLTLLLLPLMKEDGRIVSVSSNTHLMTGKVKLDDINWSERRYWSMIAYGQSKAAVIMFAFELNKKLKEANKKIISICLNPGFVHTDQTKDSFVYYGRKLMNVLFAKSIEIGISTHIFCAVDERVKDLGGEYFENCGVSNRVSSHVYDKENSKKLFELSEKLTGITFPSL